MPKKHMKFFDYIKSFRKAKILAFKDIQVGQLVELKYKHPNEMGFLNNSTTCTRLNDDELNSRIIKGSIISKYKQQSLYKWLIGIKSFKMVLIDGQEVSFEREYLFLEEEIEYIRELN